MSNPVPPTTVGGGPGGSVIVPVPPPHEQEPPTEETQPPQVTVMISDPTITEIRITRRKTNTSNFAQLTVNKDSVVVITTK